MMPIAAIIFAMPRCHYAMAFTLPRHERAPMPLFTPPDGHAIISPRDIDALPLICRHAILRFLTLFR